MTAEKTKKLFTIPPMAPPMARTGVQLRGQRAYGVAADIVSHAANWPEAKPILNQRLRCAELPWVNASGTT